jgi:hypothetical protein
MDTDTRERTEAATIAAPPTGQALVQRSAQAVSAALEAPAAEKEAVARFLAMSPDDPALLAVVALGKAYGLSPFLGELFVIDQQVKSRNAEGVLEKRWVKKPGAGRDGFLSVAQKSGVFRGLQADVVCANDTFEVDWTAPDPMDRPRVIHRHAPMKPGAAPGEARKYRGPIIGAWAIARRADQVPFFYFAPLLEHGKTWSNDRGESGWSGAWSYTSAMIVKAAGSYVLRMQFSITGIVPMDELKYDPALAEAGQLDISQVVDAEEAIPADIPEQLRARLANAIERSNELDPSLWPAAKVEMVLGGRKPSELERIAADIEKTNDAMVRRAAKAATMAKGESPEEVVDAEVVGQEETAPDQVSADELRSRLADAEARASAAQSEGEREAVEVEVEQIRTELEQLGEQDGSQGAMEV